MLTIEIDDCGRCLLNRATRYVDRRPSVRFIQTSGCRDFVCDEATIDVRRIVIRVEREQTILTNLNNPIGRGQQADNQGPSDMFERRRKRNIGHDGYVRRLDPSVG